MQNLSKCLDGLWGGSSIDPPNSTDVVTNSDFEDCSLAKHPNIVDADLLFVSVPETYSVIP
ncbi:MAG: hypothetical protein AAGI53_10740 [Planctomycetota bacterium]